MKKIKFSLLAALLGAAVSVSAQNTATQEWGKRQLEQSPRHHEWVDLKNGSRTVHCFVVYPEVKKPSAAVVVIHEIFGLTDWARNAADEVAAAGYIAIAPDLLTGDGPGGGNSAAFASSDDAIAAVQKLSLDQVIGDLNAAADYVKTLPSCNGKVAAAGFCWGGGQTFRFACDRPDLKAAFVFYGPPPPAKDMAKIKCPVYGFYAGNDARVSATIPGATRDMKAADKVYKPVTYDGAGHGFMRMGEMPTTSDANRAARDEAWKRFKALLAKI